MALFSSLPIAIPFSSFPEGFLWAWQVAKTSTLVVSIPQAAGRLKDSLSIVVNYRGRGMRSVSVWGGSVGCYFTAEAVAILRPGRNGGWVLPVDAGLVPTLPLW